MNRTLPFLAILACAGTTAQAGAIPTVTPLMMGGDVFTFGDPPVSRTTVNSLSASETLDVNNSGEWLVRGTVRNLATESNHGALIRGTGAASGMITMWEGQTAPAPAPENSTIQSIGAVRINNNGNTAFNVFVTPPAAWDTVFYNTGLLLQETDPITASGFAAESTYSGWTQAYINDDEKILMLVGAGTLSAGSARALVLVDANNSASQERVLKEGDEFVTGRFVFNFPGSPHNHAISGGYIMTTFSIDGDSADDSLVAIRNGETWTTVARESGDAVIAGRTWNSFGTTTSVDINPSGQWVMRAQLNGGTPENLTNDTLIMKSGNLLIAREGSPVPGLLSGAVFTGFGGGNVRIDNAGNVFYNGTWSGGGGILRNDEIIVEIGVTQTTTNETVTALNSGQGNLSVSDNGRYVIFEGTLRNNDTLTTRQGAVLVDLGEQEPVCAADFNDVNGVTVQDIFDFLTAWLAGSATADFNEVNGVTVQDIFDFLTAWLAGC